MKQASQRLGLHKRDLTAADNAILRDATLMNLNWADQRFTKEDILARPEFFHYTSADLERGDYGVVALDHNSWVGAVWVLFLPQDDPGYGYVSPEIGELSVSVKESARRFGLGRELVGDAIAIAQQRGNERLSLSVEVTNPALNLYRSVGFVEVDETTPGTMLLDTLKDDSETGQRDV